MNPLGLGGFILLFGFLAFNGGSQLTISNKGDAAAVGLVIGKWNISSEFRYQMADAYMLAFLTPLKVISSAIM